MAMQEKLDAGCLRLMSHYLDGGDEYMVAELDDMHEVITIYEECPGGEKNVIHIDAKKIECFASDLMKMAKVMRAAGVEVMEPYEPY